MNESPKFKKLDESFICKNCGKEVSPLQYTSRDHCPYCLHSLHVDNFPGDRDNPCKGLLQPIGLEKNKKGYQIIYKCKRCGEIKKNIVSEDDNTKLIIELSSQPYKKE